MFVNAGDKWHNIVTNNIIASLLDDFRVSMVHVTSRVVP